MIEHSRGMILVTTLIMLALIASLLFSVMQGTWLYQKLARQTRASHTNFYALEAAASHLEHIGFKQPASNCLKKTNDLNQAIMALRSGQGCTLNYKQKTYYYAVADLGVFACLKINTQVSHHWLLAVTAPDSGHEVLSMRIATPSGKRKKVCAEPSEINAGVLSWRYLVD